MSNEIDKQTTNKHTCTCKHKYTHTHSPILTCTHKHTEKPTKVHLIPTLLLL